MGITLGLLVVENTKSVVFKIRPKGSNTKVPTTTPTILYILFISMIQK